MSYMPTVLSSLLLPLLRHCDYNAELEYSLLLLQWECRIMLYDEFLSYIMLELDLLRIHPITLSWSPELLRSDCMKSVDTSLSNDIAHRV